MIWGMPSCYPSYCMPNMGYYGGMMNCCDYMCGPSFYNPMGAMMGGWSGSMVGGGLGSLIGGSAGFMLGGWGGGFAGSLIGNAVGSLAGWALGSSWGGHSYLY